MITAVEIAMVLLFFVCVMWLEDLVWGGFVWLVITLPILLLMGHFGLFR